MPPVLGYNAALQGYTRPGKIWVNEMNFSVNHAPDAGSIARPVDLQSCALPLYNPAILGENFIHEITKYHDHS